MEIQKKILVIQSSLKKEIDAADQSVTGAVKWEPANKFHLTLLFIGEADEKKLKEIDRELIEVEKKVTGIINFESLCINAFPKLKFPRVIVLELANENKRVFELSDEINFRLNKLNIVNDKKFKPHVTLARVRRDRKINLNKLKDFRHEKIYFTADRFQLMESKLKEKGSEYSEVREYVLSV